MTQRKRFAGIVVTAAAAGLSLFGNVVGGAGVAWAQAHAERDAEMTGIVVQGVGEVKVKPDIARLSLGAQTEDADPSKAARDNAALTQKIIAAVRAAGVAEVDIQTENYSIFPRYDSRPRPQGGEPETRIVGYQVSNTVRVTVRKIGDAGKVIDAAVKAGANVASGISFDLNDDTQERAEALRKAVADATRKAKVIAAAAGVANITLASIIEGGGGVPRPMYEMGGFRTASADVATPIQAGEQTIRAMVSVRFRMGEQPAISSR